MHLKGTPKTGGRQKGTKNKKSYIFLPEMFTKNNIDYAKDICRMLRRMPDYLRFKYYLELMPYLASKIESQPFKPSTPEESKQNVDSMLNKLKEMEAKGNNDRREGCDKTGLDDRATQV